MREQAKRRYPRTGFRGLISMHRVKERNVWEIIRTHVLQWLNAQ